MAVWAIGDLQGCYAELRALLERIDFVPGRDRLWFCGDLVNRGPRSLECLRFVRGLGEAAVAVLGNHDLSLLTVAEGLRRPRPDDTLDAVLAAPDAAELLDWLASRPLLHHDAGLGWTLVHAGLAPQWTLGDARALAAEVEARLRTERAALLAALWGDEPTAWDPTLRGDARHRFVVNALTRLRYCHADGRLALAEKGPPARAPAGLLPWFAVPGRRSRGARIVFGHWSTLGCARHGEVWSLDGGCVWGGCLAALRLDAAEPAWVHVPCPRHCRAGD